MGDIQWESTVDRVGKKTILNVAALVLLPTIQDGITQRRLLVKDTRHCQYDDLLHVTLKGHCSLLVILQWDVHRRM